MKKNKTQKTREKVEWFLSAIEEEQKREDCKLLLSIMQKITQVTPHMWGTSIVGFGEYHYKYKSGREGTGFSLGSLQENKPLLFI